MEPALNQCSLDAKNQVRLFSFTRQISSSHFKGFYCLVSHVRQPVRFGQVVKLHILTNHVWVIPDVGLDMSQDTLPNRFTTACLSQRDIWPDINQTLTRDTIPVDASSAEFTPFAKHPAAIRLHCYCTDSSAPVTNRSAPVRQ